MSGLGVREDFLAADRGVRPAGPIRSQVFLPEGPIPC